MSLEEAQPQLWTADRPGAGWHPRVSAFFNYWQSLRPAAGILPSRKDFDPFAIPKLLPGVWLLDIQREPFRLRYRLAGTAVVEYIGLEVTGMWLDEAHPDIASKPGYLDRYRAVVETGTPNWRRGQPRLTILKEFLGIENLLLPLASDGRHVDMIAAYSIMHHENERVVPISGGLEKE